MVENSMVKSAEIALLFFALIRIVFRHTSAMIVVKNCRLSGGVYLTNYAVRAWAFVSFVLLIKHHRFMEWRSHQCGARN